MNEAVSDSKSVTNGKGLLALSPIIVFLLSYVAVSVYIGDFYKMPISISLLLASVWAIFIYRPHNLSKRIEVFSRSAGHPDILYMVWIFILAGAFAALARELGAVDATVNLTLRVFPPDYVIPVLFVASCFISLSIGTSVGTVVALTPLAVEIANVAGIDKPFLVAVVLGGAFFGDNLSFISDTTIASTRSQGCAMSDKFKANVWIAVPAAVVTLLFYVMSGYGVPDVVLSDEVNPFLIIPYIIVIITAVMGINVVIVLLLGILSSVILGLADRVGFIDMATFMGAGVDSMGNLIVVTLLASGMLGVIKAAGGISFMLSKLSSMVHGRKMAQAVIATLVGVVNLCTANNTVAIITVGDISRQIAERYGIDPRKSASLLDSASCVVQCLIPYGAQTLMATSLAGISPVATLPYLYYPCALAIMIAISIIFNIPNYSPRKKN